MRELTFIDIEGDGSDCDADHALRMIEELDGFCVQREIIGMLKEYDEGYKRYKQKNHQSTIIIRI